LILVVVFGLLLPALVISGYSWSKRYYNDIKQQTQALLELDAAILSNGIQESLWNINQESGVALIDAMMTRNEDIIRIKVRDTALGVFVAGEQPERRIGFTASTEKPVIYRGSKIGSVEIEVGSTRLRKALVSSLLEQMVALAAQIFLSIALILLLLEKRMIGPLQRLGKGAELLASRQLDAPFILERPNEIGLLGQRLEDTRISLRKLFDELDRKNRELELDIEKRKQIEQELNEREERFRVLVEQSPTAIIEWDSSFCVIEWNAAAVRIFGYTREQAIGRHGSFINPETAGEGEASQTLVPAVGDGSIVREHIRADGEIIICQWSNAYIDDETGRRLLSTAEDITEKRHAEEALRTSQQRFSTIFHLSPVAMCVMRSDDTTIVDVNSAFERMSRRSRESMIGKDTVELQLYRNPEDRKTVLQAAHRSGHLAHFESWVNRGDGTTALVRITENVIVDLNDEKLLIAAVEDITETRRIQSEIVELNATLEERVAKRTTELKKANHELASTVATLNMAHEELVRSEKLAALGALVAGVAHELNTPIGNSLMVASTLFDQTRILVNAYESGQGMKRSTLDAYLADATRAGDILVRNLDRAANLVTSFKQVAVDQTSSQRRSFSLSEVVSEIILTLWPTIKKTTFTVTQEIPQGITLDSYPGPLGQVLTNLLNNALIHAFNERDHGTITLSAEVLNEEWIELSIEDDGVGIPAANLSRIFDPFFTTRLGDGGSGLGLNITHNIVTVILGGRIRVVSDVGVGTTFILTIPAIAPQKQAE
jgi:PAS domain S-box-containing protein